MQKIILEILSLIKSLIGLKIKKIEKEIKIQTEKEKENLTINEKIKQNNKNIMEGKVDEIAKKMKEFNNSLAKEKFAEESNGKKKK